MNHVRRGGAAGSLRGLACPFARRDFSGLAVEEAVIHQGVDFVLQVVRCSLEHQVRALGGDAFGVAGLRQRIAEIDRILETSGRSVDARN